MPGPNIPPEKQEEFEKLKKKYSDEIHSIPETENKGDVWPSMEMNKPYWDIFERYKQDLSKLLESE